MGHLAFKALGLMQNCSWAIPCPSFISCNVNTSEPRKCIGNSYWLRDGRQRGRSSTPDRVKDFHFFISSRPDLRPTQTPILQVYGVLSQGLKRPGLEADHSPPTSDEVKEVLVYKSTLTFLYRLVLNYLSIETILPNATMFRKFVSFTIGVWAM
jgi:hypothetical protein